MNKKDLIKKMENGGLFKIELPSHQHRLKTALLSRHGFSERRSDNSGYYKKKTTMSIIRKFVPIGAIAVIAILIAGGINYFKNSSPVVDQQDGSGKIGFNISDIIAPRQALAKEIVNASEKTVNAAGTLSPLMVTRRVGGATETSLMVGKDDYLNFLKEAKQAKDLSYAGDKVLPDGKRVKVLLYTLDTTPGEDDLKYSVLLGIDRDNMPVARIVYDSKAGGGIMFQQGEIGGNQPLPSGEGVQYGKIDPNAPQPKSIEEMMNFWTENLENQQESREKIDFDFEGIKK